MTTDYIATDPKDRDESNDCSVRALSLACDMPYYQAHDLMKYLGRKDRKPTELSVIEDAWELCKVSSAWPVKRRVTLAQWKKIHPVGVFYLCTRNHSFALKNGVVYDSWHVSNRAVIRQVGITS